MKKFIQVFAIILCALALCACGKDASKSKPAKKKKKAEPQVQIVDLKSDSRPIAVMINNLSQARKVQSGLSKAYMIYEIVVEGDITRYMALFKDVEDLDQIGSIRSSRHYYLDYVLENDAIYVHWGWSPQAKEDIKSLKINNINGLYDSGFYRSNPLKLATEHTGFTSMEGIKKNITKKKYRTTTEKGLLLNYSAKSVDLSKHGDVKDANTVNVIYSSSFRNKYTYDEATKGYLRFVNDTAQNDYKTSTQLNIKNIIAYQVRNYSIAGDHKGRQMLDNIGEGKGYFFTEGKSIEITWKKTSRDSQTKYFFPDGEEIVVNDGQTFIQIVPTTGSISGE